ncbi:MAG: signal peptidase I [bacterium]|nr:signal peptidase I [bacterium]
MQFLGEKTVQRIRRSPLYISMVIVFVAGCVIARLHSSNMLIGIKLLNNVSYSMSPRIHQGDLTIIRKYPSYKVGDIIAYLYNFNNKEIVISHRVIGIGGNTYITQGDANVIPDEPVIPRLILGKVIAIIPFLGSFFFFLSTTIGLTVAIFIPAVTVVAIELAQIYWELSDKNA